MTLRPQLPMRLNYCGASPLSKQFKIVTGLTPTFFLREWGIAHRFPYWKDLTQKPINQIPKEV